MYGYLRTHRFNFAFLAGLCFALFSVSSVAVTINLGPSDFRTFGPNGTHYGAGVRTMRGQPLGGIINTIPRPMNLPVAVNRPSVVPYGSIAQGAKNFLRVSPQSIAASAAITTLFMGVDWFFDQDTGQWMKDGETIVEPDENSFYWANRSGDRPRFASPDNYCSHMFDTYTSHHTVCKVRYTYTMESETSARCHIYLEPCSGGSESVTSPYTASRYGDGCPAGSIYSVSLSACVINEPQPLLESDWQELESSLPSASAGDVSNAAGDIMRRIGNPLPGYADETIEGPATIEGEIVTSTTSNPSTGLTTVTEEQTVTRFAYSPETITVTETTTKTDYGSDGSVESETVTETTPGEQVITPPTTGAGTAAGEWPAFCDWATVVCDWFDWTQDGWDQEEPDLPQIIDFDSSGDYQVGGPGECPAPYIINLGWMLNTSLEVSYQPFCDFAGLVKPLFLAFCYLFAGVITVRSL